MKYVIELLTQALDDLEKNEPELAKISIRGAIRCAEIEQRHQERIEALEAHYAKREPGIRKGQ